MSELVAWRTDEKVSEDIDQQPRRWLSVGISRRRSAGGDACATREAGATKGAPVVMNYCLFVMDDRQAEDILGLDLAQFPTEPVRVP